MSYLQALQYLESLTNLERFSRYPYKEALDLRRFQGFLDLIRHPESSLRCIHIAGTKGKGSTASFLTYILREAGFRVGLYTSPHLGDFRERIRILPASSRLPVPSNEFEGMIPKAKLASLVERLKPIIEKYNRHSRFGPLTFFEAYTAIAFIYFKEEKADPVVLETGLGGRLDATNVVMPLVSVITPISYEHTDKLGHTLKAIAREKAGIIKSQKSKGKSQKLIVISTAQEKEAMEVIQARCRKEKAKLLTVGKEMKISGSETDFRITTPRWDYKNLKIRLIGAHQLMNAATALAAAESLREYGIKPRVDSIRRGLYNTLWPGRCEVVAKKPLIVLDGAQNAASAAVLKKAIRERFHYQRLIIILGVSNDKDIQGIAAHLDGLADALILTKADTCRATEPEVLRQYFRAQKIYITPNVKQAAELALKISGKEDLILVTGSLFVVGEFRYGKLWLK